MAAAPETAAATTAVVTSPSFVIVKDAAEFMPKFLLGTMVLIIGTLAFIALVAFLSAFLPGLRDGVSRNLGKRPWQSLGLGVAGYAIMGGLAALCIMNSATEYLLRTEYDPVLLGSGVAICVITVIATFLGGIGLIQAIGARLEDLNAQPMPGLRKTFWGSLVLVGASLFPGIGWFIVLPLSLLFAFGATLRLLLPGGRS